jgi:hypothetical protein
VARSSKILEESVSRSQLFEEWERHIFFLEERGSRFEESIRGVGHSSKILEEPVSRSPPSQLFEECNNLVEFFEKSNYRCYSDATP